MSEARLLELAGLISYSSIIIFVLILILYHSSAQKRKFIANIIILIVLLAFMNFIDFVIIQFLLFLMVIVQLFNLIYVYILPAFYTPEDKSLFVELQDEVWKDIKINETLTPIEGHQSKRRQP